MKCNKPIRAPPGDTHKFVVRSCYDNAEKIIRFGARGYQDYTQHKDPKRKKSFRARHQCDKVTDKNTARYWACEYLWNKPIRTDTTSQGRIVKIYNIQLPQPKSTIISVPLPPTIKYNQYNTTQANRDREYRQIIHKERVRRIPTAKYSRF